MTNSKPTTVLTPGSCQRWRRRRDSYRPKGEPINTSEYSVAPITRKVARAFVMAHHYSGRYPAGRRQFGLYHHNKLVGVAVFSQPMGNLVIPATFPGLDHHVAIELGRFVLLDTVPANGETWFLRRCFRALKREGFEGVFAYSDPCRRTNTHGQVVFAGHHGGIYQSHNAMYLGKVKSRTLRLLPDGTVFSDRAASKIRNKETGWSYSVDQLVEAGAQPPLLTTKDALRAWLKANRNVFTRPLRHSGNHKYAWPLRKAGARSLSQKKTYPYPKRMSSVQVLAIMASRKV